MHSRISSESPVSSNVMNATPALAQKSKSPLPTLGSECAGVLISRNLIAAEDKALIEEVVERFSGVAESITSELSRRCLVAVESESIVKEFIKRTVNRYYLKTCGLTDEELGRILGVEKEVAHSILKGKLPLTTDNLKKLAA